MESSHPLNPTSNIYNLTVTFFAIYYSKDPSSFIYAVSEQVSLCDYVIHTAKDSVIIAIAYFTLLSSQELVRRICLKEQVNNNQILVLNCVNYQSFFRIRDYIHPDIMRSPIDSALIPKLVDNSVKVFPVAVRFYHIPSTYIMKDMYKFAKKFGVVERMTEIYSSDNNTNLGESIEEDISYRVQYHERYDILFILQNRSQLVIDRTPVAVEPLFV